MTEYEKRIKIPLTGNDETAFYTKCGLLIATGYKKIVIGQRGPYVEFLDKHINLTSIHMPESEKWRITSEDAYYMEYRSTDESNVKLYFQKRVVNYANYKIGYFYISPFDLKTDDIDILVESVVKPTDYIENFF